MDGILLVTVAGLHHLIPWCHGTYRGRRQYDVRWMAVLIWQGEAIFHLDKQDNEHVSMQDISHLPLHPRFSASIYTAIMNWDGEANALKKRGRLSIEAFNEDFLPSFLKPSKLNLPVYIDNLTFIIADKIKPCTAEVQIFFQSQLVTMYKCLWRR